MHPYTIWIFPIHGLNNPKKPFVFAAKVEAHDLKDAKKKALAKLIKENPKYKHRKTFDFWDFKVETHAV